MFPLQTLWLVESFVANLPGVQWPPVFLLVRTALARGLGEVLFGYSTVRGRVPPNVPLCPCPSP